MQYTTNMQVSLISHALSYSHRSVEDSQMRAHWHDDRDERMTLVLLPACSILVCIHSQAEHLWHVPMKDEDMLVCTSAELGCSE